MAASLPRQLAALISLCCLLASGAEAACTPGKLKLDLLPPMGTSSTTCASSPYALCLSSFEVTITATCGIGITPLAATGNFVPGIWSTNPGATYSRPRACPTLASGPVAPATTGDTAENMRTAIKKALEQHVYGPDYELAVTTTWTSGVLTLTLTITGGTCDLKYAITQVDGSGYETQIGAEAVQAKCETGDVSLTVNTECWTTATACSAGTRPVSISAGHVCAACPAGSSSTIGSIACTPCTAGKSVGSVSSASCDTNCDAGTYSLGMYSTCLPCNPGMYQDLAGQSSCISCPSSSYAGLPGAKQCVRCVAGVAKCVKGTGAGCDSQAANLALTASPGYQVLSITTPSTLGTTICALGSDLAFANPPLFGQCALSAVSTPTKLTLFVDEDCSVQINPMGDIACSQTAAIYWRGMRIRAHYVAEGRIASSLGTATSSFLLELLPKPSVPPSAADNQLTLKYWPATTAVVNATAVLDSTKVCSGTLDVTGGQVVGLPATPATPLACPAGSYNHATVDDGCRPCPVGNVCGANVAEPTECSNDQFQPYLGQTTGCLDCSTITPRLTSYAGAEYCTLPYLDTVCPEDGKDASSGSCVACPAGTSRSTSLQQNVCTPCIPGSYSAEGATICTLCPVNQVSPVYGLATCLSCPVGSVAKTDAGTVGLTGSTTCDPCGPGTTSRVVSPATYNTCAPCADGYYRSGDASSTNNVCNQIPAGFKEKDRNNTDIDRVEIVLCDKGEVSSRSGDGTIRTPTVPMNCQPCLNDNTYAPRVGMRACVPCRAGTVPSKSVASLPGNDQCTACIGSTFRPASSTSATCLQCTAGREVDGSSNTNCLPCQKGHFMKDNANGDDLTLPASSAACSACPINTYQPLEGQTGCVQCAAGTSTQDTGNIECARCPIGYYSPNAASTCLAAPLGTFVGTTGATIFTKCPLGTSSNELASDSCNPCSAGFFANTLGSRSCKTCPAGTFSRGRATTCASCQSGYFSLPGSASCITCKPGSFANESRSRTCKACPLGSQCALIATKKPQLCPRGYFSNKEGSRLCNPCPANTFQSTTGQQGCQVCARGTTTRGHTGQSSCQPMRPGNRRVLLGVGQ